MDEKELRFLNSFKLTNNLIDEKQKLIDEIKDKEKIDEIRFELENIINSHNQEMFNYFDIKIITSLYYDSLKLIKDSLIAESKNYNKIQIIYFFDYDMINKKINYNRNYVNMFKIKDFSEKNTHFLNLKNIKSIPHIDEINENFNKIKCGIKIEKDCFSHLLINKIDKKILSHFLFHLNIKFEK